METSQAPISILPQAYPFLFVDRVVEVIPGSKAVCLKLVSVNEWYFQGHYPGHPVMPGMLIVEAMAQVGGILLIGSATGESKAYFSSMDNVRFRRPVKPGDLLRIEVTLLQRRSSTYRFRGEVRIEENLAAEAEFHVTLRQTPGLP